MSLQHDPYFAGRVAIRAVPREVSHDRGIAIRRWVFVFVLNLIIPLIFGLSVAQGNGRVGMLFGITALLVLGWCASLASRTIGMALAVGGGIVALSQLLPFLQIFAGSFALSWAGIPEWTALGRPQVGSFVGGFAATVVTGVILIGIALALGLPILWLTSWFDRDPSDPGKAST